MSGVPKKEILREARAGQNKFRAVFAEVDWIWERDLDGGARSVKNLIMEGADAPDMPEAVRIRWGALYEQNSHLLPGKREKGKPINWHKVWDGQSPKLMDFALALCVQILAAALVADPLPDKLWKDLLRECERPDDVDRRDAAQMVDIHLRRIKRREHQFARCDRLGPGGVLYGAKANTGKTSAAKRVEAIQACLPSPPFPSKMFFSDKEKLEELFANPRGWPVPVFYHWRQFHDALQLVDFFFVTVLLRLKSLGMHIQALITPECGALPASVVAALEALLPRSPNDRIRPYITLAEALEEFGPRFEAFADKRKVQDPDIDELFKEHSDDMRIWLKYLAYLIPSIERAGLVQIVWEDARNHFDLLGGVGLSRATIQTRTVKVGDVSAKMNAVGQHGPLSKVLLIDPPRHQTLLKWVVDGATVRQINDLAALLKATVIQGGPGHAPIGTFAEVVESIAHDDNERRNAARLLCEALQAVNTTYFPLIGVV